MSKVFEYWEEVRSRLSETGILTKEATIDKLKLGGFYKTLEGKARNRTLIKKDITLYKSIYEHSRDLEAVFKSQESYKGHYNFFKRILFLVDLGGDIEKLKCCCGKKYSWSKYCRQCPDNKRNQLGRPHTEETKRKQRLSTIAYLKETSGQVMPRYNKNSVKLIEDYAKGNGYSFIHAENGGEYFVKELGYFLDAYDPIANVALEIDERRHFDSEGNLLPKDIERQHQIEKLLGCKFIRLKYD